MKSQKKKKYRIKSRPRFIISVMIMAGLIIAGEVVKDLCKA